MLDRTYSCWAKIENSTMPNAYILPKYNEFRIEMQWFCIMRYPGFICAKNQLYVFPIVNFFLFFLQVMRNENPD